ncbi:hypothetical protein [Methanobrevibacter sp.]|uniref:hypothetical protein n=1 Tax=Methanobrevibacter sp. TaxID=66852 RepID=UPI003870DB81
MICANCGGKIHYKKPCSDCGIEYMDMLKGITHPEMKRIFKRMEKIQSEHGDLNLETSLMACELVNSSLIVACRLGDEGLEIVFLPGPKGRQFIALCTDMDEYGKCFDDLIPMTNPWKHVLDLLTEDVEGFVINPLGECCFIGRGLLDEYFLND